MKKIIPIFFTLLVSILSIAQNQLNTKGFGQFDNGKMWTFDTPPIEYFEKTYGFKPDSIWLKHVRMSALRFADYCSASFVSKNGLIMTNHHCARYSITDVTKPGEDLSTHGFYAKSLKDERRVPNLYVDQLEQIADISNRVIASIDLRSSEQQQINQRDSIFKVIKKEYASNPRWKELELQTISFYSGARYALYGYRRYADVRLVFAPELQLGFYGGDPDNFTYPRYALDCSFFRAYSPDGKPIHSPFYFPFNPNGPSENEDVYVIGNPARTERLSTTEQLDFFKEISLPNQLMMLKNRSKGMKMYNETAKNDSIQNKIFSAENAIKAISGQLDGLSNPLLMSRKKAFEEEIIRTVKGTPELSADTIQWNHITKYRVELKSVVNDVFLFQSSTFSPKSLALSMNLVEYFHYKKSPKDSLKAAELKNKITNSGKIIKDLEIHILAGHINEANKLLSSNDPYLQYINLEMDTLLSAQVLCESSPVFDKKKLISMMNSDSLDLSIPMLKAAHLAFNRYKVAKEQMDELINKENKCKARIAQIMYKLYGNSVPPDATFSLRLADGIVKGYEYNGTLAPYQTTFYGLYDRYYSNDKKFPWNLPAKWQNPPQELLNTPMNFVATNDIIGGNSGSAIINRNKEAVGLIFDGNIESLPGRYIYADETNRSVSVHSGGIIASLKYIYKANRIVQELISK